MNKKFKVGDKCRKEVSADYVQIIGLGYSFDIFDKQGNYLDSCCNDCLTDEDLELMTPEPKTLDNLQKGDVVVCEGNDEEWTVLFVLEPGLYVMSEVNKPQNITGIRTASTLQYWGYEIKNQEPLEVTPQEVAEKHDRKLAEEIMEDLLLVWHENENFNYKVYKAFRDKWLGGN